MEQFFEQLSNLFRSFKPWVIIAPWEQGVRVRLGKHTKLLKSGVHIKAPFVDDIYVQSIRLKTVNLNTQTVTTKDGKTITLSGAYTYQINDVMALYNTLQTAENTIGFLILGIIADTLVEKLASEVQPTELGEIVEKKIDAKQYGLDSFRVFITDFAIVKTFRLMQEGYSNPIGWLDMDEKRR